MPNRKFTNEGYRRSFLISVEIPTGATDAEVIEYIRDNVQAGRGCLHPDDPMSRLDRDKVYVRKWYPPGDPEDPKVKERVRSKLSSSQRRASRD